MKSLFFRTLLPVLYFMPHWAVAQQQTTRTIFMVRPAEAASPAADSPLSAAGQQRAACLANTLKDAAIKQIYVTDAKRTQQTADPLAQSLKLKPTVLATRDTTTLQRDLVYGTNGNVLVVANSDTLNFLVQRLHAGVLQPIAENEYDRLVVLSTAQGEAAPAASLHYCQPAAPAPAALPPASPARKPAAPKKP